MPLPLAVLSKDLDLELKQDGSTAAHFIPRVASIIPELEKYRLCREIRLFPLAKTHFSFPPTQKVHNSNHEFRVVQASVLLFANPRC